MSEAGCSNSWRPDQKFWVPVSSKHSAAKPHALPKSCHTSAPPREASHRLSLNFVATARNVRHPGACLSTVASKFQLPVSAPPIWELEEAQAAFKMLCSLKSWKQHAAMPEWKFGSFSAIKDKQLIFVSWRRKHLPCPRSCNRSSVKRERPISLRPFQKFLPLIVRRKTLPVACATCRNHTLPQLRRQGLLLLQSSSPLICYLHIMHCTLHYTATWITLRVEDQLQEAVN